MASGRFWDKSEHRKILPTPLHIFKELPPNVPINLPEYSKNRKRTDFACFIIFAILLLILLGLTIYIWATTDLTHLSYDKDHCGNLCGHKNDLGDVSKDCKAQDYTKQPFAEYDTVDTYGKKVKLCVTAKECESKNKTVIFRQCVEKIYLADALDMMVDGITKSVVGIAVGAIFAICAMLGLYLCFRCDTAKTFTTILVVQIISLVLLVAGVWVLFVRSQYDRKILGVAVFVTLILIIGLVILCLLRKFYKLVIAIYEEATDSIFNTKMVLAVPVVMGLLVLGLIVFVYWMAVVLASMDKNKSTLRAIYCVLLVCLAIWLFLFILGCNVMIIAGVTAVHYFAMDKSTIRGALGKSIGITALYHLGTVAFGSFIMTVIKIIQIIIEMVRRQMEEEGNVIIYCICFCISCLCSCIEAIIDYLTRKAYIITAIHGKGLWPSGMRGARLIWCFLLDIIYVDFLGYAVMGFVAFLTVIISCVISAAITMKYFTTETIHVAIICCVLTFCTAFVIVYFYTMLMNVSAETIFLCYCEDKLLNDGSMARPYFMTKRLLDVLNVCVEMAVGEKEKKKDKDQDN